MLRWAVTGAIQRTPADHPIGAAKAAIIARRSRPTRKPQVSPPIDTSPLVHVLYGVCLAIAVTASLPRSICIGAPGILTVRCRKAFGGVTSR